MAARLKALIFVTVVGIVLGIALAYSQPRSPLLAYWLVLAVGLGAAVSTTKSLTGIAARAKWLMAINAAIVFVALWTTQLAARRAISATHLEYRGVHVVGVDSFTVGAGDVDADVQLQTISAGQTPWSIRVLRRGPSWTIEPRAGIEQLRLSTSMNAAAREFTVAQSTILATRGDWVAVADPSGAIVDTLRLDVNAIATALNNEFRFDPVERAIASRYRRGLRDGVALSSLDGRRAVPSAYERFLRVQELPFAALVNGARPSLARRVAGGLTWLPRSLRPNRPLLVAAAPPYTLSGPNLNTAPLAFTDSALVEVRNGESLWRFQLRTWRREPSADPGLALLFDRNPRPLDTPLPAGMSCREGAACGAISLRRLPPPVAHIALDYAGFDTKKFGMLGRVQQDADGFTVVLPRKSYRVERGAHRPVAIPVTALSDLAAEPEGDLGRAGSYWVLLAASGTLGDDATTIVLVGIGLALLLAAIYGAVASTRAVPAASACRERSLMLGVTALLALLLTRVIVGARVAFFAPFLPRSIATAVGLWVAIAVVAVGLLSWSAWVPPLLVGARSMLAGQWSARRMGAGLLRTPELVGMALSAPRARTSTLFTILALVALGVKTPAAVGSGLLTGGVVLLAWLCIAAVAAFVGPYFETFERGAWSVVEQLPPGNRIPAVAQAASSSRVARVVQRIPELPMMAACFAAELALVVPRLCLAASLLMLAALPFVMRARRAAGAVSPQPDFVGAGAAVALFTLWIAILRMASENGSMGAFVLVVFVALASVRIGRSVGSRLDSAASATRFDSFIASMLLIAPLFLLMPLVAIDMGLFLVMVVPVGFATLLAAGWRSAGKRLVVPAAAFTLLFVLLGRQILFPSTAPIRDAESHAARAAAFDRMGRVLGVTPPLIGTPMARVAARSVATADRKLAEEMLISAKPGGARDLLIPSIEQIWGAATYASAGWLGEGLGQAVVGGRGVAETVSYAENTFSVFVLAEHGAIGAVLVLALYLFLTGAVAMNALTGDTEAPASYRASRALFLVAALIVAIPAAYVAMSNLGAVPITGQNMPFLGLNAWSDVALCAGVVGIMITGAIRRAEEPSS